MNAPVGFVAPVILRHGKNGTVGLIGRSGIQLDDARGNLAGVAIADDAPGVDRVRRIGSGRDRYGRAARTVGCASNPDQEASMPVPPSAVRAPVAGTKDDRSPSADDDHRLAILQTGSTSIRLECCRGGSHQRAVRRPCDPATRHPRTPSHRRSGFPWRDRWPRPRCRSRTRAGSSRCP